MYLYDSTLRSLSLAPVNAPISILIRHSARYPILSDSDILAAGLTPEGIEMAEEFGYVLSQVYTPGRFMSSPVGRCVDTGAAIVRGAGWKRTVEPDERLSFPKLEKAWQDYLDGVYSPWAFPAPVMDLLDLVLERKNFQPGNMNVYVTHDSVLGCILAYLMNIQIEESTWPNYLDAMVFWQENGNTKITWRGDVKEIDRDLVNKN